MQSCCYFLAALVCAVGADWLLVFANAGSFFSTVFAKLWGEKEIRILILGLDGAGKTTILYRLQVRMLG